MFFVKTLTVLLFTLVFNVSPLFGQITDARGPSRGVAPTIVDLRHLPRARPAAGAVFQRPIGYRISAQHVEDLKHRGPPFPTGGTQINVDPTSPTAPTAGGGFNALGQNGWIPYDAAIAVSSNYVAAMTNSQVAAYNKFGALVLGPINFASLWGTTAGTPFDPKCFYDANQGRFVVMATSEGNGLSNIYLTVVNPSPFTVYTYSLDARLDGTTLTNTWADFPGLGYDDNFIYIGTNQFSFNSNSFQYAKVRVLPKAALYAGGPATWTDFAELRNADGTKAFAPKPARTLGSSSSGYLLNTRDSGGSSVTLWRIDNDANGPVLTRTGTVAIGNYGIPPDAAQPGTSKLISTGDCRTQDCVWQNGTLFTGFTEKYFSVAAIRYLAINTQTSTAERDITWTAPGISMYYPAASADTNGNMAMVYSRSSSTEYASLYYTGMTTTDASIEPSAQIVGGIAPNTSGRWGDYSGIANSENVFWFYGGWANSGNQWATWVQSASF